VIRSWGSGAVAAALLLAPSLGCREDWGERPWSTLERSYGVIDPAPANSEPDQTIVIRSRSSRGAHNYQGMIKRSLGRSTIYLAVESQIDAKDAPIRIPVTAIGGCSRIKWPNGWDTAVWLPDVGVDIAFRDNDGTMLRWCEERGIEMVARQVVRGWLASKDPADTSLADDPS